MNTTEQYLKKQNDRLAAQNAVLLRAFENLLGENEYLASVACGFAWDLASLPFYTRQGCYKPEHENEVHADCDDCQRFEDGVRYVPANMKTFWETAVEELQAQNEAKLFDPDWLPKQREEERKADFKRMFPNGKAQNEAKP